MRAKERNTYYAAVFLFFVVTSWLGGATRWAILFMGISTVAASLLNLRSRRVFQKTPLPVVFFTALSFFSFIQLVPLPVSLVALLSPNKISILSESRQVLDMAMPSFTPITLDISATLLELIKTLCYSLLTFSLLRVGHDTKGKLMLTKLYLALGALLLTIASIHYVFKLDLLYGFYKPEMNLLGTLSPILNSNHLATYLGSIASGSLVYFLMAKGPVKVMGLAFTFCLVAMSMFQRSRSALFSMVAGLMASVFFLYGTKKKNTDTKPLSYTVFWALALLSCFAVLGVAMFDQIYSQFDNGTMAELLGDKTGKLTLWRDSEALLWANSVVGIGRGAFQSAVTPFISSDLIERFSHVENAPFQAIIDWGLFMGGLAIILFILIIKKAFSRAHLSPLHGAAFAGLIVLAIQSLADFSFHLPAIVFLFIVYISILGGITFKGTKTFASKTRLVQLTLISSLLFTVTISALPGLSSLRNDQNKLAQLPRGSDASLDLGANAFIRHPADFLIAGYMAESLITKWPKKALKYTNYSIRRNNNYSRTHQLASMLLLKTVHKRQACLEYKMAMELTTTGIEFLEPMLLSFSQQELLNCLPTQGRLSLQIFDRLRIKTPTLAFEFANTLTDHQPDNEKAWRRLAMAANDRDDKANEFKALIAAYNIAPSTENAVSLAKHYISTKNLDAALKLTTKHLNKPNPPNDRTLLYLELASLQIERNDYSKARKNLDLAMTSSFQSINLKRAVYLKKAFLERRSGNDNRAEWEEKQAELIQSKNTR